MLFLPSGSQVFYKFKNRIVLLNHRICMIAFLLFLITSGARAQQVKKNDDGEKIVVFDDGTWRYYEAQDSILDPSGAEGKVAQRVYNYRTFQRYVAAAVANEAVQVHRLDSTKNTFLDLEDQMRSAKANGEELVVSEAQLDRMKKQVQNDQRLVAYSRSLIKRILKIGAKEHYEKLEKIYVPGLTTIKLTDEDLNQTQRILADMSRDKRKNKTDRREKEEVTEVDTVIASASAFKEVEVDEVIRVKNDAPEKEISEPMEEDLSLQAIGEGSEEEAQEKPQPSAKYKLTYQPDFGITWHTEVMVEPPPYVCDFTYNGMDEFTRQQKKELAEELFFYHTDERLKPYLRDREYMTCKGYLTSISGGFRYLTLLITINSRTARGEYGHIKSGGLLNIKLLDGKTVSLFSQDDHQGTHSPTTGSTTYKIKFPIDFQKEKILLKSEIDKVRIVWSTGYEDYEVYNVDFFINQLYCLNNK